MDLNALLYVPRLDTNTRVTEEVRNKLQGKQRSKTRQKVVLSSPISASDQWSDSLIIANGRKEKKSVTTLN